MSATNNEPKFAQSTPGRVLLGAAAIGLIVLGYRQLAPNPPPPAPNAPSPASSAALREMKTFATPDGSVKFSYPAGWSVVKPSVKEMLFRATSNDGGLQVSLTTEPVDDKTTLPMYAEGTVKGMLEGGTALRPVKLAQEAVILRGNQAVKLTYAIDVANGTRGRNLMVLYLKNGQAYIWTFIATEDLFNEYAPVFTAVAESMSFSTAP